MELLTNSRGGAVGDAEIGEDEGKVGPLLLVSGFFGGLGCFCTAEDGVAEFGHDPGLLVIDDAGGTHPESASEGVSYALVLKLSPCSMHESTAILILRTLNSQPLVGQQLYPSSHKRQPFILRKHSMSTKFLSRPRMCLLQVPYHLSRILQCFRGAISLRRFRGEQNRDEIGSREWPDDGLVDLLRGKSLFKWDAFPLEVGANPAQQIG